MAPRRKLVSICIFCGLALAASFGVLPNLLRSRVGCALADSPDQNLRVLEITLTTYEETYHVPCPPSLASLGPPPPGKPNNANAAGLIGAGLASGTRIGYTFRLFCGEHKFSMTADPVGNPSGRAHFYVDETMIMREEAGAPATANSPASRRRCNGHQRVFESADDLTDLLDTAVKDYKFVFDKYPTALAALGPPAEGRNTNADAAYLIDGELAAGSKLGYRFRYKTTGADTYTINADPIDKPNGILGYFLEKPHYFIDQTGHLRREAHAPATAASPKWNN